MPLAAFLQTADLFEAAGVHVPQRLAIDQAQGFLLLSDLGQTPYLTALQSDDLARSAGDTPITASMLYREAWQAMVRWQSWSLAKGPTTTPTSSWPRCSFLRTGTSADTWAAA